MGKYIWQRSDWPSFTWDSEVLLPLLGQARQIQGKILGQADFIGLEERANIIVEEAFATSTIEGEKLDRKTIRSSVARRLGLSTAGLPPQLRHIDGLVEMLIDATTNYQNALTAERLCGWQAALFPTGYSGIRKIKIGQWRDSKKPMLVVSGPIGREIIHYEAPPAKRVAKEMSAFFKWWDRPPKGLDGIIRAAIAHFWFVTIHPFEDGNGRISRAITDLALSQDEKSSRRLYNLSTQIVKERDTYYTILESRQKSTVDLTDWLSWFLEMYTRAIQSSEKNIAKALLVVRFWKHRADIELSERQKKVINKMLEAEPEGFVGGINNQKYVNITKVSRETAKRDLADLEHKGILRQNSGRGRSTSYCLVNDK